MKKQLLFLMLICSVRVMAQTDTAKIEFVQLPDSSGIGVPDGIPAAKEIGPAGGPINSEDGRVELIFPIGALSTVTTITIQPVTNLAPNGAGKAYRFEPSGIQFKKPVQIIFHYTNKESIECPADLMGFGLQDDKGKWEIMEYEVLDANTKTLKGYISHFSTASNVKFLALHPEKDKVNTQDMIKLFLWQILPGANNKSRPKRSWGNLPTYRKLMNFKVNGVSNGDEEVGQVFLDTNFVHKGQPRTYTPRIIYWAPKILPDSNPVTITAEVGIPNAIGEFKMEKELSCHIELYDEYFVTVTDTMSVWEGRGQYICDSSTFSVKVGSKNVNITDIVNVKPFQFKTPVPKFPCKMDLVLAGCVGTVDVPDKFFVQRDTLHPPNVFIRFLQPRTVVAFRFMEVCPGVKTALTDSEVEPIPTIFKFKADGEGETIRVEAWRINRYTIYIQKARTPNELRLER